MLDKERQTRHQYWTSRLQRTKRETYGRFGGISSPGPRCGSPVKEGTGFSLGVGGISSPGPRCIVMEGTALPLDVGVDAGAPLEKREGNTTGPRPPDRILDIMVISVILEDNDWTEPLRFRRPVENSVSGIKEG